jgi:hypothetical protein
MSTPIYYRGFSVTPEVIATYKAAFKGELLLADGNRPSLLPIMLRPISLTSGASENLSRGVKL